MIIFLLALHVGLIFLRGYFLSIEFTLYPYLTAHGFLPYKDIIDQHFPTLFFGPFSLPAFLTTHPLPLLFTFLFTLLVTDFLLYNSFVKAKVQQPLVWLCLYITSSVYFSGNILWVETFVNLFLSAYLLIHSSKSKLLAFVSGFLVSQIVLLRPTIIPGLILLGLGLQQSFSISLLFGFMSGMAIPSLFLFRYQLLSDFYYLTINFNKNIYVNQSLLMPAKRLLFILLLWLTPIVIVFVKKKRFLWLFALLSFLVLAYPRFGFEHLQPLILVGIYLWSQTDIIPKPVVYLYIAALLLLIFISAYRHPYGNYFLTKEVTDIAAKAKSLPGNHLYLLGTSDLVYSLSGKTPPYFTYLPSLPWYLHQNEFQSRVITALRLSFAPVIVDYNAVVDGYNVVAESRAIFEYIKINFIPGERIGRFQIFYPKQ